MRALVLGANGMLGHEMFYTLMRSKNITTFGTVRSNNSKLLFPTTFQDAVIAGVDVENIDSLSNVFKVAHPDVVINCIGLVKQLAESNDPMHAMPINTLLPHQLAKLSLIAGARLIHVSTDCVFSGATGMYMESDLPDAVDLYGQSKRWGEVSYPHCITLRTSIIGRELCSANGLVEWFLAQENTCTGFTRAIFSGLPTAELATVVCDYVLSNPNLSGLYHVSSKPISKFDLLHLLADRFEKKIDIIPCEDPAINRSLDSSKFFRETKYSPPQWADLVKMI
jgi:dTDP-4-dehydrorhamnose reductase